MLILTYEQAEILRAACSYRRAYIEMLRAAPNISCTDNWDSVIAALSTAEQAIEDDLFDEVDEYDLLQVQVGLQELILDWCLPNPIPPAAMYLNRLIDHLRDED